MATITKRIPTFYNLAEVSDITYCTDLFDLFMSLDIKYGDVFFLNHNQIVLSASDASNNKLKANAVYRYTSEDKGKSCYMLYDIHQILGIDNIKIRGLYGTVIKYLYEYDILTLTLSGYINMNYSIEKPFKNEYYEADIFELKLSKKVPEQNLFTVFIDI